MSKIVEKVPNTDSDIFLGRSRHFYDTPGREARYVDSRRFSKILCSKPQTHREKTADGRLSLRQFDPSITASRKGGKRDADLAVGIGNAAGALYSVFFISIVLSAVDPFICYEHPGDSGESVRSAPSLLCFEGLLQLYMSNLSDDRQDRVRNRGESNVERRPSCTTKIHA